MSARHGRGFVCAALVLVALISGLSASQSVMPPVQQGQNGTLRVSIQGETNQLTSFVEDFKAASSLLGLRVEIVPRRSAGIDFQIIIAQETSLSGSASAVIALDPNGDLSASVVRSGRLTAGGALNACAKELAKKIAVLRK
jgi:hypothetical protein